MVDDFAELGVTIDVMDVPKTSHIEIWSCCWPSVLAWLACSTQLRAIGQAGAVVYLGLDYASIDVVLRRGKYLDDVFDDLKVMEREAIQILNDRN